MNIKHIKALAKVLREQDLSVIEFCEGETRIRLEKTISQAAPTQIPITMPVVTHQVSENEKLPIINGSVDFNEISEVKSPMVGVFYQAPSPESEPFVKIGGRIKKGDVLCIIEAMKVMNEITADVDGELVDICAENGQIVEFGQTLFKVY
ncbi:MAG: acetyl-CoA carboxylase biotin carboxyl carrier protein [Clostridiales bacterium]|nr:acetyl-CoA carboxylase biotin carboxyl carrier protein [Clostridiales bacterium]